MHLLQIDSSAIKCVAYDPDIKVLLVRFPSGAAWEYSEVTPEEYCRMLNAESRGSYFIRNIRDAHPARRVQ